MYITMQSQFFVRGRHIRYSLRRSGKARRMRLVVYRDGSVVVTAPVGLDGGFIEKFLIDKATWLLKKLSYFKTFSSPPSKRLTRTHYKKYKEDARKIVEERVGYFNKVY